MRIRKMNSAVQRGRLAGLRRHDAAMARKAKAEAKTVEEIANETTAVSLDRLYSLMENAQGQRMLK